MKNIIDKFHKSVPGIRSELIKTIPELEDLHPESKNMIEQVILNGINRVLEDIQGLDIERTIARNLTAWDTSKDKEIGLLPSVYLTNQGLYKRLTGEEYRFHKACKKYHIE